MLYIKNKQIILVYLCLIFFNNLYCSSLYFPENTQHLKTGYTIRNLCWNPDSSTFAYTEGNIVFIRDAKTFELLKSIEISNIEKILFSKEGKTNINLLLALTKDGKLSTYNIDQSIQQSISLNYNDLPSSIGKSSKITAISFSQNSNYIALADSQNVITIIFKLRFTNETIAYKSLEHEKLIYNIVFSPNTWYFAAASKDNTIKLYSTDVKNNLKSITTIPFYSELNVNFDFTPDSKNIVCASEDDELSVYNLRGEKQLSIKTQNPIEKLSVLQNSSVVAVYTTKNQIELYDLSTKEFVGYLPAYNSTTLTTFSFNNDNTSLLLGYEDGSIYKVDVKKDFLAPGENPPSLQLISNEEKIVPLNTENIEITSFKIFTEKNNLIIPKIGIGFLSSPFLLNLNLDIEYKNFSLLSPLFIGGGLEVDCGLPRKNFPYKYVVNNKVQANPLLLGGKVYLTSGFAFKPGLNNLHLFLGFDIGACIFSLGYFPEKGYLITKPLIGLAASIQIGAFIKNFEFITAINYDTTNKFYPEISFGYQINLKKKGTNEKAS